MDEEEDSASFCRIPLFHPDLPSRCTRRPRCLRIISFDYLLLRYQKLSFPIGTVKRKVYLKPGSAIGTHQLVASYPGDNSFSSGTSNTYSLTVTKASSLIADFFPYSTPVANVPVMVGGQVALYNYCAPFGGTITVTDITSGTPVVAGSGTLDPLYCDSYKFPVTFPASGTRIVRVDYSGDSNVNPSFAMYSAFPVYDNTASSTTLSADLPTASAGAAVTLTAVVTSDAQLHPPTGTVTFLDGTAVLGTAALDATGAAVFVTQTLAGGQHNITASYPGDAITTASVSNPITEVILDYIFQALPGSLTIQGGQSGTATLNVIPLEGYSQAVQFSCGPLPAGVSCVFSQSSVTPDGVHPSTATLTIKTSALMGSRTGNGAFLALSATVLLGGVLLLPFGKRRRVTLALPGMLLLLLIGIGCGAGSSKPTGAVPGSFTVNVTSTSSRGAKTVAVTVNIIK
jgi:Bacterial Ig-like domain (group 3)